MTVYEDMASNPDRMVEYMEKIIDCVSCPVEEKCKSGMECKERLKEYLEEEAE